MRATFAALTLAAALLVTQQQEERAPARPALGKPAPAIRLNDHTGHAVTIAPREDGERWTVLAFFPKAATPG